MGDIIGKSAANPAIAYPEHDRLKKIKDATSKPKYEKESKELLKKNIYHVDAPEFVRSTEAAKNASDGDYKKKNTQTLRRQTQMTLLVTLHIEKITKILKTWCIFHIPSLKSTIRNLITNGEKTTTKRSP